MAVIGGSFLGLEVATSLRSRGLDVRVIAPEPVLMTRVFGAGIGAFLQRRHEKADRRGPGSPDGEARRVEHWVEAERQGRHAALGLTKGIVGMRQGHARAALLTLVRGQGYHGSRIRRVPGFSPKKTHGDAGIRWRRP